MGGARGRKISRPDREQVTTLIEEAQKEGCRLELACAAFCISLRTYQRWQVNPEGDLRRGPITAPKNKLTDLERARIVEIACSAEFRDKHPWQIVPTLADRGIYVASESTFYRVMRAKRLLAHRSHSHPPRHERPKELVAVAPNQIWSWDITYLKTTVLGQFFYLYLVMDIFSRKIIGYELAAFESSSLAAQMIH